MAVVYMAWSIDMAGVHAAGVFEKFAAPWPCWRNLGVFRKVGKIRGVKVELLFFFGKINRYLPMGTFRSENAVQPR
jgi:hypothetical protein